jgi:hypothetical protein
MSGNDISMLFQVQVDRGGIIRPSKGDILSGQFEFISQVGDFSAQNETGHPGRNDKQRCGQTTRTHQQREPAP